MTYGSNLRSLYNLGYPGGDELHLQEQFINGIRNLAVKKFVLTRNPVGFDDTVEAALNGVAVERRMQANAVGTGNEDGLAPVSGYTKYSSADTGDDAMDVASVCAIHQKPSLTCYFCQKVGHLKRECRKYKREQRALAGQAASGKPPTKGRSNPNHPGQTVNALPTNEEEPEDSHESSDEEPDFPAPADQK